MTLHCGCSGYHYNEWKGRFYPDDLPQSQWLAHYAQTFDTVEINSTFYGLPRPETVQKWNDQVPEDFRFAFKGSRYITHQKKLKRDRDLEEALGLFFQRLAPALNKTCCILWQLPGNLHADLEKLDAFLPLLPSAYKHALEFRHASWFSDDVLAELFDHRVACCALSTPEKDLPQDIFDTADFLYIRMHGNRKWYYSAYTEQELRQWEEKIRKTHRDVAYIYFNNTAAGHAVENCRQMLSLSTSG